MRCIFQICGFHPIQIHDISKCYERIYIANNAILPGKKYICIKEYKNEIEESPKDGTDSIDGSIGTELFNLLKHLN